MSNSDHRQTSRKRFANATCNVTPESCKSPNSSSQDGHPPKKKIKRFTFEEKAAILRELDESHDPSKISRKYGIDSRTLRKWKTARCEIIQNSKSKILKTAKKLTNTAELDNALHWWLLDNQRKGIPINGPILQQKARELHRSFAPDTKSSLSETTKDFKGSEGYLSKWKKRMGVRVSKITVQGPPNKKSKLSSQAMGMAKPDDAAENPNPTLQADEIKNGQLLQVDTPAGGPNSLEERTDVKVQYLDTPVKSANDKKEYRVIRLENGLTALLIADARALPSDADDDGEDDEQSEDGTECEDEGTEEECESEDEDDQSEDDEIESAKGKLPKRDEKMAACGLCVGVGSFSDPPEIPGMAHFLEHMVFMGSQKYPEENDFDAFIRKRGGSDNAATDCEMTTFHFEIQEKQLLPALDRFAQFFISPLMKRDAITREREAVESEFQMAAPNDYNRREQVFCSLAKPGHPATKFLWGNLLTLRDNIEENKLYEELHKFRQRHYSAHRMTLALQARLPLDTLEQYVKECFANVPTNGLPPDDFTAFKETSSFDTPNFTRIYKMKPFKDICQVDLTWAMPPLLHMYKSKPHQYVSWIIGHEGNGSLLSYLRKRMWCLDIISGNAESGFEHSSMYALFSLSLILTESGFKHLKDVLDAVFSYISLMLREGPQKRIYDEIHQIGETSFRFTDEVAPETYVENLSENMHLYAPTDYITGCDLYFEYNPEAIKDCMAALSPDKVNIMIFDKKIDEGELDKVEPWFKTKYADTEIPPDWIKSWKTIEPLPYFHLPEPNIYITDDFSLVPLPDNVPQFPIKIHSDAISEIWYRPDPKFKLPECYMNFHFISPLAVISPQNAAMIDLFVAILKQQLGEELYPANAAELQHQILTSDKGISVKVNGFNQKLPLLLGTIMKYMANCHNLVTEDLFHVMKAQQLKAYYNTFLKPGKLAKNVRLSILMLVHWSSVDKHSAISGIEFHQFQNFVRHFTDHIYVQSLVQGNMTKEDAIKNCQNCIEVLKCGPLLPNTLPQLRVTQIPLGIHCCRVKNFNPGDVNSVVTNYYQAGVGQIRISVMIELLIMIMEEPLYNQLRTQQQLGYDVSCIVQDTFGIFGYSITVCAQADKFTTEHVDNRIEAFVKSFVKILKETPEEEVNSVKESLVKLKQCVDIHLREEVDRNWSEITTGEYLFDRLDREVEAIHSMQIEELIEWMDEHVLNGSQFRKLSIQVVGTPVDKDAKSVKEIKAEEELSKPKSRKVNSCGAPTEYGGDVQYPLLYLTDMSSEEKKKPSKYYITDIEKFKHELFVYPVNRITS